MSNKEVHGLKDRHGLKDCVSANGVQDLAKEPVMNCFNKTFRLATGARIICLCKFQHVTNWNVYTLSTCCIGDFALSGHCQGQMVDPIGVGGVITLNKTNLKRILVISN